MVSLESFNKKYKTFSLNQLCLIRNILFRLLRNFWIFQIDLELMMKLGHGALIIFMILAVVTIIFLVLMLIMSCSAALVGG